MWYVADVMDEFPKMETSTPKMEQSEDISDNAY